jgi:hypothetical protein
VRLAPALAALRRDPAPQQAAQAALEARHAAWRARPAVVALLAELEAYGAGAPLADCPHLDTTICGSGPGLPIVDSLFTNLLHTLRDHPLGHIPLRHQYSQGIAVLQLASAGRASLSLICYEAVIGTAPAQSVCFAGGERHELCLAGSARIRLFEAIAEEPGSAVLECEERVLHRGDTLVLAGPRQTKIVDEPQGRVVVLRLARTEVEPVPAREYRIADGALVHVASGSRAESRAEMAAAVLGAMGRKDAVAELASIADRSAGPASDHLRWQALCQALALDTAAGFDALGKIASESEDPLARPAGALRAELIERYPELASLRSACPA